MSQLTALPLPSPAAGFTYAFDPATGTFRRTTRSFGPILAERAETIGRGRLSVGFNYQYFSFDSLDDVDLSGVPAVFTHDDYQLGGGRLDVVTTVNTIEASLAQWTGAITYGLTDRIDVSLAVPVVRTTLSVLSNAQVQRIGTSDPAIHFFHDDTAPGGFGDLKQFASSGSATGISDLVLRVKGNLLREGTRALGLGLDVRLPTGDERDLLGSGAVGVKPFAVFSTTLGRLAPRVNLAYQWNGESILANDVRSNTKGTLPDILTYVVGADVGVSERFSLALDLLGQHVFDAPLLSTQTFTSIDPSHQTFADIGFHTGAIDAVAGSTGLKINIAPHILANFNLRFHITGGGLRDRLTPLVGIEFGS
ncbi:MAG TPA: hypothetical protein VHH91_06075 [Vicinamibacterales bacterium]|nr:hypothetical protein [Vicinamibacterales bacterium]